MVNYSKKLFSVLFIFLVTTSLFYAKTESIKMPQKVKAKLAQTKATDKSFYLATKKKNIKSKDVLAGPFETAEQVVLVWIHNGIHSNGDVCITKDSTVFLTGNPIIYFNKIYPVVAEEYKSYGYNKAFDKYFFGETISEFNSQEKIDEKALEKTLSSEEKKQIKEYENEMQDEAKKQQQQAEIDAKEELNRQIAKTQGDAVEETPEESEPEVLESKEISTSTANITAIFEKVNSTKNAESSEETTNKDEAKTEVNNENNTKSAKETVKTEEKADSKTTENTETVTIAEPEQTMSLEEKQNANQSEISAKNEEKPKLPIEPEATSPLFDIQITKDSQIASLNRYQKEYLQDYMPVKKPESPKDEISTPMPVIENPNQQDENGRTLLMKSAKSGNNWEIESLLNSGADVNLTDNDGWTALMYAVRYQENITIVTSLIKAGAKVKTKNKFGMSPLLMASTYNGNPEIIKALLNYYSASEKEVMQAFILLLSDNSISEFSKDAKIKIFIAKSIPLNTFYNGKTPLMYSAQYGTSTAIIKLLLENGSITSIRSTEGKTAFDYAKDNNKLIHDDIYWALNKK